jgi:UPF0271 protein
MGRTVIDLNADVGEGLATDAELIGLVSSVNIACGGHAGDPATMRESVRLALRSGAAIGAHPGFEDRENFGRREMPIEPLIAADLVIRQTRRLSDVARGEGAVVGHVKLHGALYNMAARDRALAEAVVGALLHEGGLVLVALAGSDLQRVARERGLPVAGEAFSDRAYRADGSLMPRSSPGGVISDPEQTARQAVAIARDGKVISGDGAQVAVDAETLCLHGDNPGALASARAIRSELGRAGIRIAPLGPR